MGPAGLDRQNVVTWLGQAGGSWSTMPSWPTLLPSCSLTCTSCVVPLRSVFLPMLHNCMPGRQGDAGRCLTLTWQEYLRQAWNVLSWINFAIFGYVFYLLLLVDMGVAGIEVAASFLLHDACMRISICSIRSRQMECGGRAWSRCQQTQLPTPGLSAWRALTSFFSTTASIASCPGCASSGDHHSLIPFLIASAV